MAHALLGTDRLIANLRRIRIFGLFSLEVRYLSATSLCPLKEEFP